MRKNSSSPIDINESSPNLEFARLLTEVLDPEVIQQMLDEHRNPEIRIQREAREAHAESLFAFIRGLHDVPSAAELTTDFHEKWNWFLGETREQATGDLIDSKVPPEKAERFLISGWAYYDEALANVRYRFGPPKGRFDAIPIFMIHRNAAWHPPQLLEAAVREHPWIRAWTGDSEGLDMKAKVMKRLAWAQALTDEGASSRRLRELADAITNLLHIPKCSESSDYGWIATAVESDQFWMILASAVDFGVHFNARRLFSDGKLSSMAYETVLNDKVTNLHWFLLIEEAIREQLVESGRILKPWELRKHLGVKVLPGFDDEKLQFVDPRYEIVGDITWNMFQKYAKRFGKIRTDDRSD
jgi:hypothetical protein